MRQENQVYRLATVLAMLASLTGCGTSPYQKQLAATPVDQRVRILGSVATSCTKIKTIFGKEVCDQAFNSMHTYLSSGQGSTSVGMTYGSFGDDTPIEFRSLGTTKGENGGYFCEEILAGQYTLRGLDFWNFGGGGSGYRSREGTTFQFPISAKPGDVILLGNLRISTISGKNRLGMKMEGPGYLQVLPVDEFEVLEAMKKCANPVASREQVIGPLLSPKNVGNQPLVEAVLTLPKRERLQPKPKVKK